MSDHPENAIAPRFGVLSPEPRENRHQPQFRTEPVNFTGP